MRLVAARIEMRVDILDYPALMRMDPSLLGVVDIQDVDELRRGAKAAGGTMQTYSLNVLPGETSSLELSSLHQIVTSYYVEVAQSAFAFDPAIMEMISGTRLAVTCSPTKDGLGLSVILCSGDPISRGR